MYIDGEWSILKEIFNETVMAALQRANIDLMKGPPSATHRHQAWDCGPLFRGIKFGVYKVSRADTPFENATLENNLKKYILHFEEAFSSVSLTAAYKSKLRDCLQIVVYSAKCAWTADKMTASFVEVGQHKLGVSDAHMETVDYECIMSRSYSREVTAQEVDRMRDLRYTVAEEFRQNGRITNAYLDTLDIARTDDAKDRDHLALSNRDVELLTHADTIAAMRTYLDQRAMAVDPLVIAEQKQIATAQKLVDAAAKKNAKDTESYQGRGACSCQCGRTGADECAVCW